MAEQELHVVTGAFGYSGKYITARLLLEGKRVRTLTNSPNRENPFNGRVEVQPYHFKNMQALAESLRGADVLYNTYWVRFNYAGFRHAEAEENTRKLFEAARLAGVKRIVHSSITNASESAPLEYFRAKARLEIALRKSGISHAILRPAVLFGKEDILINNIAWTLRHFPVFGVPGWGRYRVRPIYVDDYAALAVEQGKKTENVTIDAVGPQTFTFWELVRQIAIAIGAQPLIVPLPATVAYTIADTIGWLRNDVMLTWDEVAGLMKGLLCSSGNIVGRTPLTVWAHENRNILGRRYASELARRKNRRLAYEAIRA